jgi:hypothetical protein
MGDDIQHKQTFTAPPGFGFEAGERVPIVLPVDSDNETETEQRGDSRPGLLKLIALLTENATPLQAGQRMHLIAYLVGVSDCKTHTDFARKLNVSPGRVSQIIRELPSELSAVCNLKSRTAKAHSIGG